MSLCPKCETDLGSAYAGETCPRCGVRLSARRRSLSGFSLPAANAAGVTAPSTRPTAPPRPDTSDDSWGVSDIPPPFAPSPPSAAPTAPKGLGLGPFRAPTHVAPRTAPTDHAPPPHAPAPYSADLHAPREVGTTTMLLTPQAPPPSHGDQDPRRTSVGLGARAIAPPPPDTKRTLVNAPAAPLIPPPAEPATPGRQTLIMGPAKEPAVRPAPPPAAAEGGAPARPGWSPEPAPRPLPVAAASMSAGHSERPSKSTLVMTAAPSERPSKSTLVMTAAPSERPSKSTLVMTSSPLTRPPADTPEHSAPRARRQLDLRPPVREAPPEEARAIPALPPVPDSITDRTHPVDLEDAAPTEVMRDADVPFARDAEPTARETVDPLGATQPIDDVVELLPTQPIDAAVVPTPPLPTPPPPPTRAAPSRPEEARVAALVSGRGAAVRPARAAVRDGAARRLKVVSLVAGALLTVTPWLAPLPITQRAPAVAAGAVALVVGAAPLPSALRGALSVGLGALLLGALLGTATDLSALGLGLTGALLLVLPGALFFRRDEPDSAPGRALLGLGLAVGVGWALSPGAGDALHLRFPPVAVRDFATIALFPWLLLGALSIPRRTAAVGGGLFASGLLLWSGALGMLRSAALALPHAERWRAVAAHGVAVAALSALMAAGVAYAVGAAGEERNT